MSNRIQNAVALGISADTSDARRELRQMHTILRQVKDPAKGLEQTLRHLKQALSEGEIGQRQFSDASAKAEMKADKQRKSLEKLRQEYDNLGKKSSQHPGSVNLSDRKDGVEFLRQFQTEQNRANSQLKEANRLRRIGAITSQEYANATKQIRIQNSAMAKGFRDAKVAAATLLGPLVLVTAAFDTLRDSIRLSADLAAAEAKFRVFIGSLQGAKEVLKEIRDLSSRSPISFQGGQRAVTTMLQFGVASGVVVTRLKQIAEITAGDAQRMESLALAFAQSQAAGRLMGQELLQMVNAGFNPLKIISDQTGRSLVDLKKDMENGAVSSEMVAKAFEDATAEGGKFNGLLNEMAGTSFGRLTRLNSEVEKLKTNFGDLLLSQSGALDSLNDYLSQINKSLNVMSGEVASIEDGLETMLSFGENSVFGGVVTKSLRSEIRDYLKSSKEAKELSDKLRKGQIDRSRLSKEELESISKIRKEERARLKVTKDRFRELRAAADKQLSMAADQAEARKIEVEFRDRVGAGFFSNRELRSIESYRKDIEAAAIEAENLKRVEDSFGSLRSGLQDQLLGFDYGSNADQVRKLVDQSVGAERDQINSLIESKASYDEIFLAANSTAQMEAKKLGTMRDQIETQKNLIEEQKRLEKQEERKVEYFEKQKKGLDDQISYQRDLIHLTKAEAEVRKLMRQDDLTREQAEQLFRRQRELGRFDSRSSGSTREISAPKAIQAGSREAFSVRANRQAQYVQHQIQLQQEQIRIANLQNKKLANHTPLLRKMADNPGVQRA